MIYKSIVMGLLLIFMGIISTDASAHKVNVFAYVEGDQIYIQGYFSDGHKAKNSDVTVYGGDGQELMKGQTDEEGVITFPIQGKQSLRIVLNAGQGHQASYLVPVEEITGTGVLPNSEVSPSGVNQSLPPNEVLVKDDSNSFSVSEAMVRKAVAQGVLPLAREISEMKERRGFSDIVGGIGLIVGLLGIFAYVKARQETRKGRELDPKREG
jgi:nickel transport protein